MMRSIALAGLVALTLTACGGSRTTVKDPNYSAKIASQIESQGPADEQSQNPGFDYTFSGVGCVQQAGTESYSCNATITATPGGPATQSAGTQTEQVSFTGTCDSTGNCSWHSN
jgi:hypothetical protein